MSFTSPEFVLLLVAVLPVYFLLGRAGQNWLLLGASFLFYGWWDWRCLGLLALSSAVGFGTGLGLAAVRSPGRRLALLYATNAGQLALLAVFKYYGFFAGSLADGLASMGVLSPVPVLSLVLPIGISFYTFHTLSYTIDVYRGDIRPTRDPVAFALFISYFPQLIAGPIARAGHLLPQMLTPRRPSADSFFTGSTFIVVGLVKKVVVADNLAPAVDGAFRHPGGLTAVTALLSVYAFAAQIYCDFSGYSDMARGCAKLMGFELTRNFDAPYFSTTPSEFWRRWHVSLSSWLRDYLFIPLGGSRGSTGRTYLNLFLTMLLGGLWHGASWTFVFWGVYHGLLLCAYRAVAPDLPARLAAGPAWRRWLHTLWFFHLVCFGWLLFRADGYRNLVDVLGAFARPGVGDWGAFAKLAFVVPVAVLDWAEYRRRADGVLLLWPWAVRVAVYVLAYVALVAVGNWGGAGFIYFQF